MSSGARAGKGSEGRNWATRNVVHSIKGRLNEFSLGSMLTQAFAGSEGRVTTISSDAIHGHTVFQISVMPLDPAHPITNVYAIYGDGDHQMLTPPAFHVPAPFGCDIGGTNPAFWEINADSQWDSWLTVGVTEGNVRNEISSIGVDWSAWTQDKGMSIDDGAIFWMDPDDAVK